MKHLFLLALVAFSFAGNAQQELPYDTAQKMVVFQKVITMDSTCTKDKLYDAILLQLATIYNKSTSVIQYSDKNSGSVICKGAFSQTGNMGMTIGVWRYTMRIDIKDYKCRVTIDGIVSEPYPSTAWPVFTAENVYFKERWGYAKNYRIWTTEIISHSESMFTSISSVKCQPAKDW